MKRHGALKAPLSRHELSQKAYGVLCREFFRNGPGGSSIEPSWLDLACDPIVLEQILWFFRHSQEHPQLFRNVKDDFERPLEDKLAWRFIRDLTQAAWEFPRDFSPGRPADEDDEVIERLKQQRPTFLEIMLQFHGHPLNFLTDIDYALDQASTEALERLALIGRYTSISNDLGRPPQSLDEAFYAGSEAAYVLNSRRIKQGVRDSMKEVKAARLAREEAEATLRRHGVAPPSI